jgi:hypothetical protein
MTYTFKLARRLAMSRKLAMLSALLLLAACAGDTTGPESTSTPIHETSVAGVRVVPRTVTIETNQRIRFRGQSLRGREVLTELAWSTTGGATISTNGMFSASTVGTYKVVGRGRGRNKPDTSVVVVIPPPTDVVGVEASPDSVALAAGTAHTFTALGRLADGTTTSVGVTWTATGGAIDAGGVFTAGNAAGKFRVVVTKSSSTLADTANVTISAPAPTDTTPPPPPPAPTLASVILSPASVSLVSSGTKQFAAYGRNSAGDSVAVTVTYAATGGSISSTGLYTAGSTGGTFRVVAAASGLSDTSVVSVTAPLPSPTAGTGLPFGPYRLLTYTTTTTPFTLSAGFNSPSTIVTQINDARTRGVSIMLAMTGGPHSAKNYGCCLSVINGVLQFDHAKWSATQATFNTATIRDAIAKGVADGTIIGATVMDEPHVVGAGDGNTWGPRGTMTKARVDSLCREVKQFFPTLPVGVEHQHQLFEPTKSYQTCDFIVDQYNAWMGPITTWRDAGLAMAARDHHAILFSLNVLDGGVQDKDGTYDCTGAGQAGKGTYAPNCRMTATQLHDWGLAVGPSGCGLLMWQYDGLYATNYDNQRSFKDIAAAMGSAARKACRKS